eukprot:GGOE01030597.1.p4 GENE.GGOE01030597.1~~GGOE01030597.1.p4  ORF type:complete len:124 (+),score=9.89 GGOE01030597.1:663-1034(+)
MPPPFSGTPRTTCTHKASTAACVSPLKTLLENKAAPPPFGQTPPSCLDMFRLLHSIPSAPATLGSTCCCLVPICVFGNNTNFQRLCPLVLPCAANMYQQPGSYLAPHSVVHLPISAISPSYLS